MVTKKYKIERSDQYVSLRKRAKADEIDFNVGQDDFYLFINKNRELFYNIAEQHMTPYVDRIDTSLPYQIDNLKVVGKPRSTTAIEGRKGDEILKFASIREAHKFGYSKKKLTDALKTGLPLNDYVWTKSDGSITYL